MYLNALIKTNDQPSSTKAKTGTLVEVLSKVK